MILSGTHIGQGAVIGAGSIVSGNVPPYAIFVKRGVIKYRFKTEICNKLQSFKPHSIQWEKVYKRIDMLYMHISEENVEQILKEIQDIQGE